MTCPDGHHCANNPSTVHICAHCFKQGHGEGTCWLKKEGKGGSKGGDKMPWMRGPKAGGDKAKGKGKHDKGKAKGKNSW